MKILNTFLYLLLLFPLFYFSGKSQAIQKEGKVGAKGQVLNSLLTYLHLITEFGQFWVLTRVFPWGFIAMIFGFKIVALLVTNLIGAISGFSLPENKEKIAALTVLKMFESNTPCLLAIVSFSYLILLQLAPLVVYWTYEQGTNTSIVLIALFMFTLPRILGDILNIFLNWSLTISPFVDDDLRNAKLTAGFSSMITSSIYLLFPIWLFNGNLELVQGILGFQLPNFWILISIPIVIFILGTLIPYFIGIYLYKGQLRQAFHWRQNWIEDCLKTLSLPEGQARSEEWKKRVDDVEGEILRLQESNTLLKFFTSPPSILNEPDRTNNLSLNEDKVSNDSNLDNSQNALRGGRIGDLRNFLRGTFRFGGSNLIEENIRVKIDSFRSQLTKWDNRFFHLDKLVTFHSIAQTGDKPELKNYLESEFNGGKNEVIKFSKKNWLTGVLTGGFTAIIVFLFKHFEEKIIEIINSLVKF